LSRSLSRTGYGQRHSQFHFKHVGGCNLDRCIASDSVCGGGVLDVRRYFDSDPDFSKVSNVLQRVRDWAKFLKRQVMLLWFSYRHPQTPWLPKVVAMVVVAYALSPIDLIPDFIPTLGYLDDVILLPLGIWLVIKLMPADVLEECRRLTLAWEKTQQPRPVSRVAAIVILLLWLTLLAGLWKLYTRY